MDTWIASDKWENIGWVSGLEPDKRKGFLGFVLDLLWPTVKQVPSGDRFLCTDIDGVIMASGDGCIWSRLTCDEKKGLA